MAHELQCKRGRDARFRHRVTDQAGRNVSLASKTLTFVAKLQLTDPDPVLITKTTGAGIVHDNQLDTTTPDEGGAGWATTTLQEVDTDVPEIAVGRVVVMWYELLLNDGVNDFPVEEGRLEVGIPVDR